MRRVGHHQAITRVKSPRRFGSATKRSVVVLVLGTFLGVCIGFAEAAHLALSAPDHHADECRYCIALLTAKAATVMAESAAPVGEMATWSDTPAPSQLPLAPHTHKPLAPRAPPSR